MLNLNELCTGIIVSLLKAEVKLTRAQMDWQILRVFATITLYGNSHNNTWMSNTLCPLAYLPKT